MLQLLLILLVVRMVLQFKRIWYWIHYLMWVWISKNLKIKVLQP